MGLSWRVSVLLICSVFYVTFAQGLIVVFQKASIIGGTDIAV